VAGETQASKATQKARRTQRCDIENLLCETGDATTDREPSNRRARGGVEGGVTCRARLLALIAAVAALHGGCATNETSRYLPSLSSVVVPLGDGEATLTALVSVAGELKARRELPDRIELRLRFDNHGAARATLVPDSVEVATTELRSLGRPELTPAAPIVVPPGGEATVSAVFAIPPGLELGSDSLRALSVHFTLTIEGQAYASNVTFDRVEQERRYPPFGYGDWPSMGFDTSPVIVVRRHGHPA
jgi:hypothetical protein